MISSERLSGTFQNASRCVTTYLDHGLEFIVWNKLGREPPELSEDNVLGARFE